MVARVSTALVLVEVWQCIMKWVAAGSICSMSLKEYNITTSEK